MESEESPSLALPVEHKETTKESNGDCYSKEDLISIVTSWYRDEFWKYLGHKGMVPLKTCHEEIIKGLQERIQQTISKEESETNYFNNIWEQWEEIRAKLVQELAYCEAIVDGITKAQHVSISQYTDGYEEQMIKFLQKRITKSEVNSLKTEISQAHEAFLKEQLEKIDERCHKIIKLHLTKATKGKLQKIIDSEKIFNSYTNIMRVYFENFICFSDESFQTHHQNAAKRSLDEFSLNRSNLKSFDNHILNVARQKYEEGNKDIRENEVRTILKVLQDVDEFYMEKLLASQVCKIKDIKSFHAHFTEYLVQVVNKSFDVKKRGFDLMWLKKNLDERITYWIKANDRKLEQSLKLINRSISDVEIMFTEAMKFELSKNTFTQFEFELTLQKRKAEAICQIESKLRDSLPSGRRKQIQQLETQMHKLSEEFRLENRQKCKEEESKKCLTPALLIEFGPKVIRVGYVDGILNTGSFDSLKRLENFVTFTTEGKFLVGKTSPEKVYEISIERLILSSALGNYPEKIDLPGKMIEIPINLLFISSLVFTYIKETAENNNIEFPSAVITIPLWFSTDHRLAIKNAGIAAGFNQVFLINDLSAAALSHYSRQRRLSVVTNEQFLENQASPPILIISADDEICYAGLFRKKNGEGEHPVTMLFNIGNFHLPISKDIHAAMITKMINVYPNISQVMICSDNPMLETIYGDLVKTKIPSCSNYMAVENVVLHGAAKYSEMLADKISAAKNALCDKTFYHLLINDNFKGELMQRNKDLNIPVDSRHTIDTTGKTQLCIFETPDGRSTQRFIVDNLMYEGKRGDKIQLTCAATHEGYFDVHTSGGILLFKEERQKQTEEYAQMIKKHFKTDKEFESIRINLISIANYMIDNIGMVPGIMRDQIQEECQEALQLVNQTNAQKELVRGKMDILQKFKARYYNPSK